MGWRGRQSPSWSERIIRILSSSIQRLNSRQARWALFFGLFRFTLSYRPGSKNIKRDAVSPLFACPGEEVLLNTILPQGVVVAAVSWGVERWVSEALRGVEVQKGCPNGQLFVLGPLHPSVLELSHSSRLACHPGVWRTLAFAHQCFWWPSLSQDVGQFVAACSVCAQNKTSNKPPFGQLQPLPILTCPWSHFALDFVNGLPSSKSNTVTVVHYPSQIALC